MANETKSPEELALEAKREYHRNYYRKNKKKLNAKAKQWREENPEKAAESNRRYWMKKALEKRA